MAQADDPRIGTVVAGFRIEALVGRGGMGVVYRAEQLKFGRKVALKILAPELAADAGFRQRFEQEWRTAAGLEHLNIVPIFEADEAEGVLYIAMRYVEGADLSALLSREGRLQPERALSIIGQVAVALDAAHVQGLVHRDVKPGNILIWDRPELESDHVYLTDFGVAKTTTSRGLTRTGFFVGTIDYASPEQIEGRPLDGRADVYSLGCVLYHCLAGARPFEKDSDVALLYAHLMEPVPRLSARRPDLPPELDPVIERALAKSREDRYTTCAELVAAARAALALREPTVAPVETVVTPPETAAAGGVERALAGPPVPPPTVPAGPPPAAGPPTPPEPPGPSPRRWWRSRAALVGVAAIALAGAGAGIGIGLAGGGGGGSTEAATTGGAGTTLDQITTSDPTTAEATTEQATTENATTEEATTEEATTAETVSDPNAYPNAAEGEILAYVDTEVTGSPSCQRTPAADQATYAAASVVCTKGKVTVYFDLYKTRAPLDRRYGRLVSTVGGTLDVNTDDCKTDAIGETSWWYSETPDVIRGRRLCWTADDGRAALTWTVFGPRIFATAVRPDANHLALENWWLKNS